MKKIILVLFIGLLFSRIVAGQPNYAKSNYVPMSPNAASLARFADVQVSDYTGIPNVSIPITELRSGSLKLPVTLTYHAGGIRVSQEASWAGLGWALNAGGCITRQVRGRDDFDQGYATTGPLPPNDLLNRPAWINSQNEIQYYADINSGVKDGEPDIFYYNFGNYSGKVMFAKQPNTNVLTATSFDQNSMKFEYSLSESKWTVTDPKGVKYVFSTTETTVSDSWTGYERYTNQGCTASTTPLITCWYLSSITSPDGDEITFTYDKLYQSTSQVQRSELVYYLTAMLPPSSMTASAILPSELPTNNKLYTANWQKVNEAHLKEVNFADGKITITTKGRTDMQGSRGIDKIDLYYKSGSEYKLYKTWRFHHDYFNKGATPAYKMTRLRLDSLVETGAGNVTLPAYKFSYNQTVLPNKTSHNIDHWGFFNNKNNEAIEQYPLVQTDNFLISSQYGFDQSGYEIKTDEIIPSIFDKDVSGDIILIPGADRNPDATAMQAGILTKIVYPTKGSTTFEYEANQYSSSSQLYKETQKSLNQNSFTLAEPSLVYFYFSGTYADATLETILKRNGINLIRFKSNRDYFKAKASALLPPGSYTVASGQFHSLTMNCIEMTPVTNKIGGGIRIKKIINNDSNGAFTSSTRYEYEENGKSTGKLVSPLQLFYNETLCSEGNFTSSAGGISCYYLANYIVRSSYSCIPFGNSAQGNVVGYDKVIKYDETSNGVKNGKTLSYFKNIPEVPLPAELFIPGFPSRIYNDNGQLLKEEKYNSSNNLVSRRTISYTRDACTTLKGVKTYSYFGDNGEVMPNNLEIRFYDNYLEWWYRESEVEDIYSSTGTYVSTATDYYHDDVEHKLLTGQKTRGSNGLDREVRIKYPKKTGIYPQMANKNMYDYPVEQVVYNNNKITGSTLTTFKASGSSYVPDAMYKLEITAPVTSMTPFNGTTKDSRYGSAEVTFNLYDAKGKPLQVTGRDGIVTSYLWDSTGNYLKALVEGSPYSSTVSAQAGKAPDYSSKTMHDALKSLPNTLVSTYKYKPLIGVCEITNPNGVTTYYDYDLFGRLNNIINDNQKVVGQYNYNYKR